MDKIALLTNLLLLLSSGFAFIFGVVKHFKRKTPLFWKIIISGLGCMMLGRVFNVVLLMTSGEIYSGFHVGRLGLIGGFMFLLSASFGQMNGLVDGGEKIYRKYRLLSLLAPVTVIAIFTPFLFSEIGLETKIVNIVTAVLLACSSYYNLKHLIMPDVDMGILKSIRAYNFLALILTIFSALEACISDFNNKWIWVIISVIISAIYVIIVPVLVKGAKKWTL